VSGLGVPGRTAVVCSTAAVVAFLALALFGQPRAGIALGAGLALGGVNGLLAARSADALGSFRFFSLMRLGLLSTVALAIGLLLDPALAWVIVAGVAASQFVLTAVAIRSVLRS
jgi:phage gp46-like protein